MSSSYLDYKLYWYSNDGFGNYTYLDDYLVSSSQTETKSKNIDIDNDGDQDIIASVSNSLIWYENTDGLGHFSESNSIVNTNIGNFIAVDINNDGFEDVLSSNIINDNIKLYLNSGLVNFSDISIAALNDSSVKISTADINNDGNLDIVTALRFSNTIIWYENLGTLPTTLPINSNSLLPFLIYPNPSNSFVNINAQIEINKIYVYNNIGLLVLFNHHQNKIDISNLDKGIYFIKIEGNNGLFRTQNIVKK